jgi:hypothetical protein
VDVVVLLPRNTPPKTLLQSRLVLLDVQVVTVAAALQYKQVTHMVKNPRVIRHQALGVTALRLMDPNLQRVGDIILLDVQVVTVAAALQYMQVTHMVKNPRVIRDQALGVTA